MEEKMIENVEYAIKNFNGRAIDCIAIGNLIKAYKDLKEENEVIRETMCELIDENKELKEKCKEMEKNYINPSKARISYYDTKKGTKVVIEGFVPKSLIKEKMNNKIIALKTSYIDNILKSEFERLRDELLKEEK